MLKPIAYDFDARFDVARLQGLTTDQLQHYKQERVTDLQNLIGHALADLKERFELVDWFDRCTRLSEADSTRR